MKHFLSVLGIAVAIALAMTLLALVPPVSYLYRWLTEHDLNIIWIALVAGIIGGVLSFYPSKKK